MAKSPSKAGAKASAIATAFDAASDPLCAVVRNDVDTVLSNATDHGITPITSNDDLLANYMPADDIQALYILLNRRLAKYPGFQLFGSNDIKATASVGDVRSACYAHCNNLKCSHI